jgi:hypothetical protein
LLFPFLHSVVLLYADECKNDENDIQNGVLDKISKGKENRPKAAFRTRKSILIQTSSLLAAKGSGSRLYGVGLKTVGRRVTEGGLDP